MRESADVVYPAGFFLARYPILPIDEIVRWSSIAHGFRDERDATLHLAEVFSKPPLNEALFLASPDLWSQLGRPDLWSAKTTIALAKYFLRAGSRPTPFGLFAGVTLGKVGSTTNLAAPLPDTWHRRVRLDHAWLERICDVVMDDNEVRRRLRYRTNTSCHLVGCSWHYLTYLYSAGRREYSLARVAMTPFLDDVLLSAERQWRSYDELRAVVQRHGASTEESDYFLEELLHERLLVPECEPPVTGDDPFEYFIAVLQRAELHAWVEALDPIRRALARLNETPIGGAVDSYSTISDTLAAVCSEQPKHIVQVDMHAVTPSLSLGPDVLKQIIEGVNVLRAIGPTLDGANTPEYRHLANFKEEFDHRYGEREVPLSVVLDEECGIGWNGRAHQDRDPPEIIRAFEVEELTTTKDVSSRDALLLEFLSDREYVPGDLFRLLPATIDALAQARLYQPEANDAIAICQTANERGTVQSFVRVAVVGLPGAWFGRACNLSTDIRQDVQGFMETADAYDPEAIHAEVVHIPQGRLGNISHRPILRSREIPYLSNGGVPLDDEISVNDLSVSVRNGQVELRQASTGRRVIPHVSNAHNALGAYSPSVYRFLYTLQYQNGCRLVWDWGPLASSTMRFLPRVISGDCVLGLARWRLNEQEISGLINAKGQMRYNYVRAVWEKRRIPRFTTLDETDNRLLIDVENNVTIDALATRLRQRRRVLLTEVFGDALNLPSTNCHGTFQHELIVPLILGKRPQAPPLMTFRRAPGLPEYFAPATEWLYAKIYCRPRTATRVLQEVKHRFIDATVGDHALWFFVRYRDPEPHIRLRVRCSGTQAVNALMALGEVLKPWKDQGLISRWELPTYMPEIDRYGGPESMRLCERLFNSDSNTVLRLLGDNILGPNETWKVALLSLNSLFDDFRIALTTREPFLRSLLLGYGDGVQHLRSTKTRKALGALHRREKTAIVDLLESGGGTPILEARAALRSRSSATADEIAAIIALNEAGNLTAPLSSIWAACVHMHMNRLIEDHQRQHEFLVYSLLEKYYISKRMEERVPSSKTL